MFTVGPRLTMAPLPRSSDPTTCPYRSARDVSKVAARDTAEGIWVTPVRPSPTPVGPSSSPMAGTHRRGIAEMKNTYGPLDPVTMLILSASVMRASTMRTRWPIGSDRLSQGHEAPDATADGLALPAAEAGPPSAARASSSARPRNPAIAAVPGDRHLRRRLLADETSFI